MADKLLIIMVNTDTANTAEFSAPLFQAAVAASMEYDVEVIFTGRCGGLAKKGTAERIYMNEGGGRTAHDFIREAFEAGVVFKVCTPALDVSEEAELIPEIEEVVGAAYMISRAMADDTVTLTY